jgi:hypothetical protein
VSLRRLADLEYTSNPALVIVLSITGSPRLGPSQRLSGWLALYDSTVHGMIDASGSLPAMKRNWNKRA